MEHNKGLGSDGFPARTLSKRTCWSFSVLSMKFNYSYFAYI
jgi:hypothetical protein